MGLDILTERLQLLRADTPAANRVGWLSIADLVCLDDFLRLLSGNLSALAQFKNLLINLIITASEAVNALQLIVAQLETANNILETFLQTFKSSLNAATGSLKLFPFSDPTYLHCPAVQTIKSFWVKQLPKPDVSSLLPGNAKKFAKKYKQTSQSFKELEYRLFKNSRSIIKTKRHIDELRVQILAWQAIVDAIGEQFGV